MEENGADAIRIGKVLRRYEMEKLCDDEKRNRIALSGGEMEKLCDDAKRSEKKWKRKGMRRNGRARRRMRRNGKATRGIEKDKLCGDLNRYGKAARGMEKEQRGTAMRRDGDERPREAKE